MAERTAQDWRAAKEARDKRIFDMWLACHTQEEIAKKEEVHKDTVSEICREMADLPKSDKPAAEHLTDFEPLPHRGQGGPGAPAVHRHGGE